MKVFPCNKPGPSGPAGGERGTIEGPALRTETHTHVERLAPQRTYQISFPDATITRGPEGLLVADHSPKVAVVLTFVVNFEPP